MIKDHNWNDSDAKFSAIQYTSTGIHKDDLLFNINGLSAKKFASQGQQKTFLVALKLAQYEIMRIEKKTKPILMFDDIFDKLDEQRVSRLMEMVAEDRFGQILLPIPTRSVFTACLTALISR